MILPHWLRRLSRTWFIAGRSVRQKQKRQASQSRRPRTRLMLEGLEERVVPSTFEVVPAGQANNTTTFATLSGALAVAHNGDTIQIEPGSTPGGGTVTQNNLTIQGDPAVGAAGLQTAGTQLGDLTLEGNNDTVTDLYLGNVFIGTGKMGETVSNSIVNAANVQQIIGSGFTDGGDTITGNTFLGGSIFLGDPTSGSSAANDTITNNVLTNPSGTNVITAQNETSGLVISGNRITINNAANPIIAIDALDSIGVISDNQIQLANNAGNYGIIVQNTNSNGNPGNANIAVDNNTVNTSGAGIGIATTDFSSAASLSALIAGNVLTGNNIGIKLFGNNSGSADDYGNVSIGGSNGAAYSAGGNNLSGYSGTSGSYAIETTDSGKAAANTVIPAEHNLFGVANPQTVVFADTHTIIDTSNAITGVKTTANNESATFSNGSAQTLSLSASVTDPLNSADIVNGGTVTFTIKDKNGNIIGNSVSAPVINGSATANNYSLPADQAAGSYTIDVGFSDPSLKYGDLGDISGTLMVNPAQVTTTANTATAVFSTAGQTVNLSATVADKSDPSDTVTEGTVTFTVEDSKGNIIGTAKGTVSGTNVSAAFSLPAGQAAGTYTILVRYSDSLGNFVDGGDTNSTLTVSPASVKTTAATPSSVVFSTASQTVSLSATVADASHSADTVGEGTITFTVKDLLGNSIGTAQETVSGGKASTSFTLPAAQLAGTYTVAVSYTDSAGNFTDGGDTSSTLTVSPAAVKTTANTSTAVFSTQAQTVSLSATVADTSNPADLVNEGSVTFTIKDSNGNTIGSSPISATVSNGTATVNNYSLPAGAAAGSYTILVSYSDPLGNFVDEGDNSNTLTVTPANVKTMANTSTAIFSTAAQTVSLSAAVADASHSGDVVNEGSVTFTLKDSKGNTIGSSVPGTVNNGSASATVALPAGQAAGAYTIAVSYTDSVGNFTDGGDTSGALTVSPAKVTTTANNTIAIFSTQTQTVSLSATVADTSRSGDAVKEGSVIFTLKDGNGNTIGSPVAGTVSNGKATASYTLPAGQGVGGYTVAVRYTDGNGNFADNGDANSTLTIISASPSIQLLNVSVAPSLFSFTATETLTAHVSSTGNSVHQGTVTFSLAGKTLSAAVNGNGDASVQLTLPLLNVFAPQGVGVSYGDASGDLTSTNANNTLRWLPINAILPSTAQLAANGSQTIDVLGSLLTFTYDPQGRLTALSFEGIQFNFIYNDLNELTQVTVNGITVLQLFYGPQGQPLSGPSLVGVV